jgi:protoporphyrinogen oxidase
MLKPISRTTFLKALGAGTVAAASGKLAFDWMQTGRRIPCRMLGPSKALGHRLRHSPSAKTAAAGQINGAKMRAQVTIVGAGIAGLSAAWWLQKQGMTDFIVLELEKNAGGNSVSGQNQYSAYPWGAHYVPLANKESTYVRLLFEELGVIRSSRDADKPNYNELYLCHDPQERLFKDGSFQEGLVPKRGLQPADKAEIARFFEQMVRYRQSIGRDGKPAFAIPLNLSSQDEEFLALDRLSMAAWLKSHQFQSRPLLWYVNYCCRDDYGSSTDNVSAWAAIHYFAGRRGLADNAEANAVVTWPEGNGFIVSQLSEKLGHHLRNNSLVASVRAATADGQMAETTIVDTITSERSLIASDFVIFAAPRFVAKHVIADERLAQLAADLVYAPWMVANITLSQVPEAPGESLSWDNVNYYSDSLGYVVATHQNIQTRPGKTVITYYYPLAAHKAIDARKQLYNATTENWSGIILADLEKMHPGITSKVESIDLWPWAHGMISPAVGYIWGEKRRQMKNNIGNIYFAHSDMSGISNFEEAQYQGVQAAQEILTRLA